jgi:mannosyltransferase
MAARPASSPPEDSVTASRSQAVASSADSAPAPGSDPAVLNSPWVAIVPALITLLVTLYRIGRPSFTRDEGATLLAVHRSFPQMVRMLGNIDVVHGEYYALIWAVTRVAGSSELATRFPSAVAMAVAAGGVTLIGQRLVSGRAGLAAGLVTAALPTVSYYAEDAREYAMEAGLATVATYLLVRALEPERRRRHWLVAYGVVLAALGLGNFFSLLIIPAHAIAVAVRGRRGQLSPGFTRGWLIAVAAAVIVVSPVAVTGFLQRQQVSWIKRPGLKDMVSLYGLVSTPVLCLTVGIIVALSIAVSALGGRSRLVSNWPAGLVALAVPWLLVPPALLLALSFTHPVFVFRYVAFCIPAAALLAGTALAALGRIAGVAALAVIVLVGLPAQAKQRSDEGHGYNIRGADRIVARYERAGDALLNVRYWPMNRGGGVERGLEAEYPFGLSRLRDIGQQAAPVPSATLGGTFAPQSVVSQRLAGVSRLWVASWSPANQFFPHLPPQFVLVRHWHVKGVWLWLYARHPGAAANGAAANG